MLNMDSRVSSLGHPGFVPELNLQSLLRRLNNSFENKAQFPLISNNNTCKVSLNSSFLFSKVLPIFLVLYKINSSTMYLPLLFIKNLKYFL